MRDKIALWIMAMGLLLSACEPNKPVEPGIDREMEKKIEALIKKMTLEEKLDRKRTRLNSSHMQKSRMPSSA